MSNTTISGVSGIFHVDDISGSELVGYLQSFTYRFDDPE